MARYYQSHPTLVDLQRPGQGLGFWPFDDDVPLFQDVEARAAGINVPGIRADATIAEALVYQTLINLALVETRLSVTYATLNSMIAQGQPVRCAELDKYNKLADDWEDQAVHAVSVFVIAGLGDRVPNVPTKQPRFEIGFGQRFERCMLDVNSFVAMATKEPSSGNALGVFPLIGWAVALVVAAAVGTSLVLLAASWGDVRESEAASQQLRSASQIVELRTAVWERIIARCGGDTACIAKNAALMKDDLLTLQSLLVSVQQNARRVDESGHSVLWWLGLTVVLAGAGAGIYHYKTHRR